jgi:hypothetical protein
MACGWAQAQLPLIRLDRLYPPGGRVGSTVEITVSGDQFEDVRQLRGDHPGLAAEFVKQEGGSATFRLSIAPGTPLGTHDLRAVGRYGISNSQLFEVSDFLTETLETEPNNQISQANPVSLNSVINGTSDSSSEDYFRWHGQKGQRVILDCFGSRLGNTLEGALALLSTSGKELAYNRGFNGPDPLIDFTVPEDGEYLVKLYDFNYNGGNPYRLRITTHPYLDAIFPLATMPGVPATFTLYGRNLPGGTAAGLSGDGAELQKLSVTLPLSPESGGAGLPPGGGPPTGTSPPGTMDAPSWLDYFVHPSSTAATIDGFQYRVTTPAGLSNPVTVAFAAAPPVEEREPNDTPETAQELSLPCEVNGRLDAAGDQDWFALSLKAGQTLALEGYCQRLGARGDLVLLLQNTKGEDLAEIDDSGISYNQRFQTTNRDPAGRFTAPQEGKYFLLVTDRYQRGGARFRYRLRVSPPQPDYRPVVVHNTENTPSALLILQGGSQHYHLIVLRQDGFDGEVSYSVEGLPPGVRSPPGVMGPGVNIVPLVFTAAPDAPPAEAVIRVHTWATIDGKRVDREARSIVQSVNNQPLSRLARNIVLAVRPSAPYALTVGPDAAAAAPGATIELRVAVQRRWADFTGALQLTGLDTPQGFSIPLTTVPAGQAEAIVRVTVAQNAKPGTYTLVLRGDGQVPFTKNPDGKDKKDVRVTDPSTPVQVTVTRQP